MSLNDMNSEGLVIPENDFWLETGFQILSSAFSHNKMPHGVLISGAKGYGQLILAKAIAASLLCQSNNHSEAASEKLKKACGTCKSCLLLNANSHPDFDLVERLVDKGKLKQNISIDQVRGLSQKLVQTSQLQGWRIAVINSVEYMNISSFNAILKTLEEPGNNTLLILINEGTGNIPATIKSRCQLLNLSAEKHHALEWLSEKMTEIENREDLGNALTICHGAPYASLEFIEQGFQSEYKKLFDDLDSILRNQLSASELLNQHKETLVQLLPWIANYFHGVSKAIVLPGHEQYKKIPQETVLGLYNQLIQLNRAQSSGSNLQLPLQLEAILIHWFEIGRKLVHYSK